MSKPPASKSRQAEAKSSGPRLYLVTPAVEDATAFARELKGVLGAADIAAVMLRLKPSDERTLINRVKALSPAVQSSDTALVIDGHPAVAARAGADGAHLTGIETFLAEAERLKPERIVGCGGLAMRHDAMIAGENGADYVMFGEPVDGRRPAFEAIVDRVEWWAEVFEIPCVGYADQPEDVAALAKAGADFVAIGDFVWKSMHGAAAAVTAAAEALAARETAA
jgi:thiamine-phosphate pyrophosphorylase